jgi:hypothetical protein
VVHRIVARGAGSIYSSLLPERVTSSARSVMRIYHF